MQALSQSELVCLGEMLERAIKHQQLNVAVWVWKGKVGKSDPAMTIATTDLFGTCANENGVELIVSPSALKWLWDRYAGTKRKNKKARGWVADMKRRPSTAALIGNNLGGAAATAIPRKT